MKPLKNKRILVTGAAGSIGSEIVRQLAPDNEIYGIDINESRLFIDVYEAHRLRGVPIKTRIGDIRDRNTVEDVIHNFQPEIIFHAAALKHVTPLEHDPREAVETNVIGTCNLVEAAKRFGVSSFVFISTDKAASPEPSVMGMTKRLAERVVRNAGYITVRFGNVLGSNGSLIPIWQKQIEKGGPLTVTDENMERYFMTLEEAVALVIGSIEIGQGGDIIVLDMGKPIKILDLAKKIINESGRKIEIKMIGKRPGELITERLMTPEEEQRAVKKDNYFVIR